LFRDVANITMDLNDVEQIQLAALGGADTITVNDLSGTDMQSIAIDLGSAAGTGDGSADTIVINATNGDDVISIANVNGVVTVSGLATQVTIAHFDANDRIVINGLGGDDVIEASGLGTAMLLTANGGDGNDILIGSAGSDILTGGAGDDVLIGGGGLDVLDGGPGDNVVIQSAGFNASSSLTASARLAVASDKPPSGSVLVNGHAVPVGGGDTFSLLGNSVALTSPKVFGTSGNDVVDVSAVPAGRMGLSFIGGAGEDIIRAGGGNDIIDGGSGNDVLTGGAGDDTFLFTAGVSGHDVVQDFQAHGAGAHGDLIALAGFSDHGFDQAVASGHITQVGVNVMISDGADTLIALRNTSLASLGAQDFRFT